MNISELVANEEFKQAAGKVETVEEAVALCESYGIEISGEELVDAIQKSHREDLNEEALDNVSGGGFTAAVYALGFVFGTSPLGALCICGGAIVGGVLLAKYGR